MTPRELDWRTVRSKLRTLNGLLEDLRDIGAVDAERLSRERITALAVERLLTLVVELASAINTHLVSVELRRAPETYAGSFTLAAQLGVLDLELADRLVPSAGMRNILVHAYLEIDPALVAAAVPVALEQYGEYVRQVARYLQQRAPE